MQASILDFIKRKKELEPPTIAYRFLIDIPRFMLPNLKTAGPFKKGDLVSKGVLPDEVWKVLLVRGAVKPYHIQPEYPKGGGE